MHCIGVGSWAHANANSRWKSYYYVNMPYFALKIFNSYFNFVPLANFSWEYCTGFPKIEVWSPSHQYQQLTKLKLTKLDPPANAHKF